jgi:crossover junction endodeoxyribonuclease RusA
MALLLEGLPMPVTLNGYYRAIGRGIKISKRGRESRKNIMATVAHKLGGFPEPMLGPLRVTCTFYPASKRRWDLDNRTKCLLDALTDAAVWEDDSQIWQLYLLKGELRKGGACDVAVEEI